MISRCFRVTRTRILWSQVNNVHCRTYHAVSISSFWPTHTVNTGINKNNKFNHRYEFRRNINNSPNILASAVATTEITTKSELSFAELGLGGYSPVGFLQNGLEFLHSSYDLPWFATIAVSTIIIRILMTPLIVVTQRNTAKMCNLLPVVNDLQNKMHQAGQAKNAVQYAQYKNELDTIMKEKGYNPMKNMLVPLAQAPIFISYYLGINEMVDAPVESLQTGGIFWFTDLTVPDPYFILPLMSCGTIALMIYMGTDGARSNHPNKLINYFMKSVPIIAFPFIMNFPSAIVVYWITSNVCSLIQTPILKIEKVRKLLKIPKINPMQPKKQEECVGQSIKSFDQPKNVTKNLINYELLISRNSRNSTKN